MIEQSQWLRQTWFWNKYLKGRPQFPDSFFERTFNYHSNYNGQFAVVHDAGAGVDVHSERRARKFEKVIISDLSEENVRVARDRLSSSGKYEFIATKLEDTINFDAFSVDMVFAGTMLH